MEKSIIFTKSYDLAVAAYKQVVVRQKKGSDTSLQWWLSCISEIGANLYLAQESFSANNLSIKLYSARKACNRSIFATMLLRDSEVFTEEDSEKFVVDLTEIVKMLQESITTILEKRRKKQSKQTED
jgi:four helix bundle protein